MKLHLAELYTQIRKFFFFFFLLKRVIEKPS